MSVCTVSFVAARGRVAKRVLCLHSILRRSPGVSRSGCCVCTVSLVAARGRVAKRVLCLHSILRRSPVVARSGCCVCTVFFGAVRSCREAGAVFAQYPSSQSGRRAKQVLCLHSILRSTKTLVGDV